MTRVGAKELGPAQDTEGFLRLVLDKRQEPDDTWVFRGQRVAKWDLAPKIDRDDFVRYRTRKRWTREEHERWLLKEFKKAARPHTRIGLEDTWEWLALGQHYGLATRLLDWTANSLGALFFAVEHPPDAADSSVWCYHHESNSSISHPDPFCISQVTAYWPAHITPRITVQGGCFTAHPEPAPRKVVVWPGEIRRIIIPRQARQKLRNDLMKLGITRGVLFPDLDGIAASLNTRYSREKERDGG
jgi:hypothetical protein